MKQKKEWKWVMWHMVSKHLQYNILTTLKIPVVKKQS